MPRPPAAKRARAWAAVDARSPRVQAGLRGFRDPTLWDKPTHLYINNLYIGDLLAKRGWGCVVFPNQSEKRADVLT